MDGVFEFQPGREVGMIGALTRPHLFIGDFLIGGVGAEYMYICMR